ncbi:N-acetylneuraminate synthase family protein [Paludibacterium purpuratum]|uniref:N-acetylneuraminate synthase n=1 Tax=Paludibacterium purpuratum TaxID=1144873 RepID=A0A4V3DUS4_9NEIS|nr:N-acetylneuraminate synthase family protein [Paludibacterium purpuratum]TDR76727.1 N-acetylneuraminate synthase [Paludibacterium purpuratum]
MHIKIQNSLIGYHNPVFIIAEGCDNHLGNIATAKEMIREAKRAGADAIKFQHHLPDEEMLPDTPMSDNFQEPLYEFLKKYALTLEQHRELKSYCDEVGILYMCTPFSLKAAQEINSLVPAFKIGSGEMTDIPSLVRIGQMSKPMIVSTGMCTLEEIDRTYNALANRDVPLVLMNCLSEYPPVYEDLNLGVITEMIKRYPKAVIGHSDHTPDLYTCFAATALGARVLEKHVILDKSQPGPDQSVSIEFDELAKLVEGVRKIEVSLGTEKRVQSKEKSIRTWAFRSIVSLRPIAAGEVIQQDDIWSKRPGTGIPAHQMDNVIGKKVIKDIPANTLISWADLDE